MADLRPYLAVVIIQTIYSIAVLLTKAVFDGGMNCYIFTFYRQAMGSLILVPLAMFFHRRNETPLSAVTMLKIFMLALVGITLPLNAYGVALAYTSATLGGAAMNCLPVSTFFLALLFRLESVTLKTKPGIVKVTGLVLCVAGVATFTFYRGPHLKPFFDHHILESRDSTQNHREYQAFSTTRWVVGCFLFLASVIAWSLWFIFQAKVLKSYPAKLNLASLQCLSSAVQSFVIAIAIEREPSQWKLGLNMKLVAVAYSGIFVTSLSYYLQIWVIQRKGPVFQAISQPLTLIMTMIGSVLLLGEAITLGSVLGGILLVISLYAVLWGKSKEQQLENQDSFQGKAAKECRDERNETELTSSEPALPV